MIVLIIDHFSVSAKFDEIPQKRANSAAQLEIPQLTGKCGPY